MLVLGRKGGDAYQLFISSTLLAMKVVSFVNVHDMRILYKKLGT